MERLHFDHPVVDAETAAETIGETETVLLSGTGGVAYPKEVLRCLANADRNLDLTVISGGTVGDVVDKDLVEADAIARRYPYQNQAESRDAINRGDIAFHDPHLSQYSDKVEHFLPGDAVAIVEAIEVGEDWFVPSLAVGPTPAYVERADRVIVELNERYPLELKELHDVYRPESPPDRKPIPLTAPDERIGTERIPMDPGKVECVVRTTDPGTQSYSFREVNDTDQSIADNFTDFLLRESRDVDAYSDTIHLQFGAGSLGNALMSALSAVDIPDRDLVYFGEIIMDGLLDMIDEGKLQAASATALALSTEGQRRLIDDIETYAEDIVLRPSEISNNPSLINQFGVMGVNSALEVDIYGHVNSSHIDGRQLVSGVGGSGNYIRNGFVGVVALPSITGGGTSRVVPMVPHVDHTEQDVDVIITEHGVADLRWCSPDERAEEIISACAHPEVRTELREYRSRAKSHGGHIHHDLSSAFDWQEPSVD